MPLPFIDTSLRVCAEFISVWFPEVGKSFSNVIVILTLPLKSDSNYFIQRVNHMKIIRYKYTKNKNINSVIIERL
ncbi:hypothetical protein V1478_010359 [Vespula squamosa]|uniref:Uncharacterized protein n=1 Tax=Vespula squamosa TaxID=30214 RepID=A0ABD2AHJ4_VESSQ